MPLTKPDQEMRCELKQAADLLKWSGVDLMQAAGKFSETGQDADAQDFLKITARFKEYEDELAGYAEDIKK